MINFSSISVGSRYERKFLAKLWGYKEYQAISKGVFSPRGQNILIFFITKDKQKSLTQYEDHIDSDILFWEGEKGHGSDKRIIERKDIIHVFFRKRHHSPFIYEGRAILRSHNRFVDRPSKFTFELIDQKIEEGNMVAEIQSQYGISKTEREAIIKSRIGQGLYRNRAIELWKTCSVTGFTKEDVLIASHIKPWKMSSNEERINPYNSLLLVPTLDKLFDNGYIAFESNGNIMLSNKVDQKDWNRIGINKALRLREVPYETKHFLNYHCEYIYELAPNKKEETRPENTITF
ncbi:MAG: HNH endonuclease [Chitinispirillaceae bacterium]|nr:HNH endonuclease [Chitinispirillaceae bacterium]